ncbi:unnamed protein product [Ectocarpus sp. CCAP 1310/34]|nr:unnamed protein product [Ectocarpus sp. CCAP 1310/34]
MRQRAAVRSGVGRGGTHCKNFVGPGPGECEFGLEHLLVRVLLHTLSNCSSRVVHPSPPANGKLRELVNGVQQG